MRNRLALIVFSFVFLGCRATNPGRSAPIPMVPSPVVSPEASRPFKVFSVYTEKGAGHSHYAASGYMGDSDLSMSGAYVKTPEGNGPALRVSYKASGPRGWAGIYWQNPPNNWADVPGRAGYDLRGATRLTFWARGERGGERVHEFRIGGIVGQYPDSDVATLSNIRLSSDWKQYTINLSKKDLRHIIAGFGFSVLKAENPSGMQFYLDEILFEGPPDMGAIPSPRAAVQEGQMPSESTATVSVPVVVPTPPPPVVPESPAVAPDPPPDLRIKEAASGLKVSFSSRLMFMPGQSVLEPVSNKVLDQLIALLGSYPGNRVLIEGHTDATGNKAFNLRLSELRGKVVRDYLIKQGGYDVSRFQVTGYGDTRPIASNSTKLGRLQNRRVEVTILKSAKP